MGSAFALYRQVHLGGRIVLPELAITDVERLRTQGYSIDLIEAEGWANAVLHGYRIPAIFSKSVTELLIKLPMSYRNGKPDMFWTDPDLLLKDGRVPHSAENIENALGKQWRRFSWHPTNWNPGVDDLATYLEFVNNRLAKSE